LNCYYDLFFEITVNPLHDSMVSTRDGSADAVTAQPDEHSSPPPTLAQGIRSIRELRAEQNQLPLLLVTNSKCGDTTVGIAREQAWRTYVEFLTTQPPTFVEAREPLEVNHWLSTIESNFKLLHYTKNQKTMFAAQQLLGDANAWWANFAATRPANQE
jgi:hypothetical protein